MTYDWKIGEKVFIKELEANARVISIWITEHGTRYECRWFNQGKIETAYFYRDEICIQNGQ